MSSDFSSLLGRAQQLKQSMQNMDQNISTKRYTGRAGVCSVTLDGEMNMLDIVFHQEEALSDQEQPQQVIAAFQSAKQQITQAKEQAFLEIAQSLAQHQEKADS